MDTSGPDHLHWIRFIWGETLEAHVEVVDAARRWMYLYPHEAADRSDNIERIFVSGSAIAEMRPL